MIFLDCSQKTRTLSLLELGVAREIVDPKQHVESATFEGSHANIIAGLYLRLDEAAIKSKMVEITKSRSWIWHFTKCKCLFSKNYIGYIKTSPKPKPKHRGCLYALHDAAQEFEVCHRPQGLGCSGFSAFEAVSSIQAFGQGKGNDQGNTPGESKKGRLVEKQKTWTAVLSM